MSINSLKIIRLKILKTYIKINWFNSFIWHFKSSVKILIFLIISTKIAFDFSLFVKTSIILQRKKNIYIY